jgi:hypothetical protein
MSMIMSEEPTPVRWKSAVKQAARETLAARWVSTCEALQAAREEHRRLQTAAPVDVRALRKAAQRVHDLEQLYWVLAQDLEQSPNG